MDQISSNVTKQISKSKFKNFILEEVSFFGIAKLIISRKYFEGKIKSIFLDFWYFDVYLLCILSSLVFANTNFIE